MPPGYPLRGVMKGPIIPSPMNARRWLLLVVWLGVAAGDVLPARQNPQAGNAEAIQRGATLFRSRCSGCHGSDARGYLGPDLLGILAAGATDQRVLRVARNGVPDTEMPPQDPGRVPDGDLREILGYLRSLGTVAVSATSSGNAQNGERLFRTNCAGCHRVSGRGGQLGPDLTSIGSARSRQSLAQKIRGARGSIRRGFEPVTIVTRDGQRIRGVRKNEDEFSIQIMDVTERLQGFLKANVAQVTAEERSLMPVYGLDRFSERELDDLLRYLETLRRAESPAL